MRYRLVRNGRCDKDKRKYRSARHISTSWAASSLVRPSASGWRRACNPARSSYLTNQKPHIEARAIRDVHERIDAEELDLPL